MTAVPATPVAGRRRRSGRWRPSGSCPAHRADSSPERTPRNSYAPWSPGAEASQAATTCSAPSWTDWTRMPLRTAPTWPKHSGSRPWRSPPPEPVPPQSTRNASRPGYSRSSRTRGCACPTSWAAWACWNARRPPSSTRRCSAQPRSWSRPASPPPAASARGSPAGSPPPTGAVFRRGAFTGCRC